MSDKDFGIWAGEKAIDLPQPADAGLYFIGRIHTPWKERKDCPKNARESEVVCTVEVDTRWREALKDVETCTHVVLLYWMDRPPRNPGAAGARPSWHSARHVRLALPGPPQPDRHERGQIAARRRQPTFSCRARLPGRHAAPRYQALFRFDRQCARGRCWLAQTEMTRPKLDVGQNVPDR